jgi:hypothetical protein
MKTLRGVWIVLFSAIMILPTAAAVLVGMTCWCMANGWIVGYKFIGELWEGKGGRDAA